MFSTFQGFFRHTDYRNRRVLSLAVFPILLIAIKNNNKEGGNGGKEGRKGKKERKEKKTF